MPKCRLRSYDRSPPGSYPFEQTEGIRRKFPAQPLIEAQARIVSDFRGANGLPRAGIKESLEDVDAYQCQRLGNNPTYCTCGNGQAVVAINASSPIISPCHGCGAPIT